MGSVGDPGVSDWPWSGPTEVCRLDGKMEKSWCIPNPGVYMICCGFCIYTRFVFFPTNPGVYDFCCRVMIVASNYR